jgi:hypothetical protein
MINRRAWLAEVAAFAATSSAWARQRPEQAQSPRLPALFTDIEQRTFRYFRDTTTPSNGLAPDRWPSAPFASIAATGFALTALPIGVERGWMTRADARARALATLRFFWNAPQGNNASGMSGYKGFFYHFLDLTDGTRFRRCELSSVDTTLLLGGILFVGEWFNATHPEEAEIRDLAARIYRRVDWRWMQKRKPLIAMGWRPEGGFIDDDWRGYNEAMLVYLLALASPTFGVEPDAWSAWCASYRDHWRGEGATRHLAFAPHFGHQYSHIWVDFRGLRDAAMRAAGLDYFENSRRATYAQRAYAVANPMGWNGYSADIWGLTACDGPGSARHTVAGRERIFRGYSARGPKNFPDGFDDGTIAPTAAIASLPFAPEIVVPATLALHRIHGERTYARYGFTDAFNPSFRNAKGEPASGTVDPVQGWVSNDLLGIDQGPIVAMIANARDDLVWRTMRRSPILRRGLKRAGFTGGWLM